MSGWKAIGLGSKTNAKVLAVLMVAILTASGALVLFSSSEASMEYKTGGSITYDLGSEVYMVDEDGDVSADPTPNYSYNIKPDGTRQSFGTSSHTTVKLNTYYGVKATEYNPEFWTGWGEVYLYSGDGTYGENGIGMWNVAGPMGDATWKNMEITATRTGATTSALVVTLPTGFTNSETHNNKITIPAGDSSVTVDVDYTVSVHKVFGGWTYADPSTLGNMNSMVYPGDIVAWNVETLYACWILPDLFAKTSDLSVTVTDNGDGTGSISSIPVTEYTRWTSGNDPRADYIYNYAEKTAKQINEIETPVAGEKYTVVYDAEEEGKQSDLTKGGLHVIAGDVVRYDSSTSKWVKDHDGMFSSIYYLDGTKAYYLNGSSNLVTGTYRTQNPYALYDYNTRDGRIDYKATISTNTTSDLLGNVVVDNITFDSNKQTTHGASYDAAIVTGAHRLILGTNISTLHFEKSTDAQQQEDKLRRAPNILGGRTSNDIIEKGKSAILNDGENTSIDVDIGSFIIIHSGIYTSVASGPSKDATMGSDNTPISTYAVLKDCMIADTIGGASSNGRVNSHLPTGSGYKDGGSFIYLVGAFTMGDYWQDQESGYADFVTGNGPAGNINGNTRAYTYNWQSSVAHGGSLSGTVTGSSHLIIAGDSSVWDCMGAGRDRGSYTGYSYLEISGRAEVRRVACGLTTDGSSDSKNNVGGLTIRISDDALVASVYGGGFDTWSYPSGNTMLSGTINIDISGGTIGDVYGGGYRGTIGTSSDTTKLKINIRISGDTVIEGNVYGGGSGGLNKMKHIAYDQTNIKVGDYSAMDVVAGQGFQSSSGIDGNTKSTGKSYVYGTISVDISGGTVKGDVYGGGMSVPKLLYYSNIIMFNDDPSKPSPFVAETEDNKVGGKPVETATVVGDVTVRIGGDAVVDGSVYGAGKGIKLTADGYVDKSEYGFNKVVYRDGSKRTIDRMYWVDGGESSSNRTYDDSAALNYPNYAQVKGNVTVIIENEPWYHNQDPVIGSSYTVDSSDADKNKFIVLHRGTELPSGYNVVKVDRDGNATMIDNVPAGNNERVTGVQNWMVGGTEILTDNYTVNASDADDSKTIVIYERAMSRYTVIMIDGAEVSSAVRSEGASIALKTSRVDGSVYGGGGFGRLQGSTMVSVDSGIVGTNVFGGGLGVAGRVAVEGNRVVYIQNESSITGSVYGGSEVGIDGKVISEEDLDSKDPAVANRVQQQLHANRSGVVMQGGFVKGSVFGGGLMGKTYGDTAIFIGYYLPSLSVRTPTPVNFSGSTGIQLSVGSVFAGGNISSSGDDDTSIVGAYTDFLVMGSGYISIYGSENKSVDIPGSIMGSGNACKTRGDTDIEIVNMYGTSDIAGIHRATTVTIDRSNLSIAGRSTVTEIFNQVKVASIFDVGELVLKGSTSISFGTPMDDIETLRSLTSDGTPTTDKSPQNRLVFRNGPTLYVRYADANDAPVYGKVEGFTLMVSTQGDYGAYAMASTTSTGGFSVNRNGSSSEADTSVSDDICCWYVSGISKKISTMYLQLDDDSRKLEYNETYITINKFQSDTSIMFTGGVFTKMSNDPNGDPYTFVRPGAESMEDEPSQLSLALAYPKNDGHQTVKLYDPTSRTMSIADGQVTNQPGTFFKKDGMESDIDGVNRNRSLVSVPMAYSTGASSAAGAMNIYLCLTGRPVDSTSYVGYVTLTFQEIKQVNYESVGPDGTIINTPRYLVANTIELRVDVYIYGSPTSESSDTFSVEVKTAVDSAGYRDGSASTLIPQTYSMAELNLARVDIVGAGSGSMGDAAIADESFYKIPESHYYAPEGKTFDKWKLTSGNDTAYARPDQYLYIENSGTDAYIIDGRDSAANINNISQKNGLKYYVTVGGTLNNGSLSVNPGDIVESDGSSWSKVDSPDFVITDKSMAIRPVWKDILNVVFDRNGGTGSMDTIHIGRDVEYVLPESDAFTAPEGQKFAYWSVRIGDDRAITRDPGDVITVEGDVVVKAIWAPKVTVSFLVGEHGTGIMGNVLAPSGQRYTLPMSSFTPNSTYEFGSWSVVIKDRSDKTISTVSPKYPGETVKLPSDAYTATVTAQWISNPSMNSVSIVGNGAVAKIDKNLAVGSAVDSVDGWFVKGALANQVYTLSAATSPYVKDVKLNGVTMYHIKEDNTVYDTSGDLVSKAFYTDPECMDPYSVGTDIGAGTVYAKGYIVDPAHKDNNNFIVLYQAPNDASKYTVIIVPSSGSPTIDRNHAAETQVLLPDGTWVDKNGGLHSTGKYQIKAADADTNGFIILYQSGYDKSKITALHVAKVTYSVADGTKFRLPDVPFDGPGGREFAGWSVSIGGGSAFTYQPGTMLSITGGASVGAIWKTKQTIGFARGEESKGQGTMDDQYAPYDGEYVIPSPDGITPQDGYEFYRWNCNGSYYYPSQVIKVTGNMLLTAEWISTPSPTHFVVFDPSGEAGFMHMQEEDEGREYVLPNCDYTSSDRVFRGWSVTIGNETKEMFPGETVVVTDDVYARAIWAARFGSAPVMKMVIFVEADQASATIQRSVRVGSTISFTGTYYAMVTGAHDGTYKVSASDADEYGFIVLYRTAVANTKYTVLIVENGVTVAKDKGIGDHVNLSLFKDPLFCKNVSVYTDANKDYKVAAADAISGSYRYIILSAGNQVDISFNGGTGGTGSMSERSILRGASRYVLPDCDFTAPTGQVFNYWKITCGNGFANGNPGQSLYQSGIDGYIVDGYKTVDEISAMAKASGLMYCVTDSGTITDGPTVSAGAVVSCNGSAWSVASKEGTRYISLTSSEVLLTAQWKPYTNEVRVDFDSGVTIYGTVGVTAEPNQDNTSGWSNLGKTVTWDLHDMELSSESAYIGTLLGSIVGNVSFSVSHLYATDSSGEVFLPSVDLVFDRGGAEAHTTLVFSDIREYSVVFIDHGFETVVYYPENTLLTRDLCESPSGNNFSGWYLDSGFVNRYDYNMVVNDESDGMRLYARYTYVVTLDCMNGVKYTLQVSEEDSGALLTESDLPVPDYTGYTFAGWCKDSARIYDWSYQSDRVYEDTTLYARWIGKEVRIYFWYEKNGELLLFDGDAVGQSAVAGKYNLQQAYMLDSERGLYPTVTWGGTFDVKDPYTGQSILEYAENTIDFGASFVKWSVVSPTDSSKHVGIYSDTVVGSKVLQYVTDSMMEGCRDLWEYYLLHDGGYPRADWVGDGRPDTMEIHLKAETTKIAIRVDMGLLEEDEKYSPTVTIDDPESFLVYPNGPDLNNPNTDFVGSFYDEYGQLYYAGIDTDPRLYWKSGIELYHYDNQGVLRHNTSNVLPAFYWNEDGSIRYIYDTAEGCWTCLDESAAEGTDSTLTDNEYLDYVTFPKGSNQQYRVVSRDDPYGNTVDASKNLKSVAYAVVSGVEKKFLVEWDATSDDYYSIDGDNLKLKDGNLALYVLDRENHTIKYTANGSQSKAGQEIEFKFYVDTGRQTVYIPGVTADPQNNRIYADTFNVRKYYDHVESYTVQDVSFDGFVKKISSGDQTLYYMNSSDVLYQAVKVSGSYPRAYSGVKFYTDSVVKTEETLFKHNSTETTVYLADIPEYQEFVNLHQGNGGLTFYLKDTGGKKFSVESVSKATGSFTCTVYLEPWSGNYHEFIFKLNNAVRSGYTLHGWHNEYISWENAMTPSADQIRKIHLRHDDEGNVTYAKLISEDSSGNVVEIPLLVGDYVVDPKDADASGNIAVVPNDNLHPKPVNSTVTKIIEKRNAGDIILLDTLPGGGKWYVNGALLDPQTKYTVATSDADIEGNIIVTDTSASASAPYLVTLVDSDGSRTTLGKYTAGQKISFDEGSWKSKNQATIDSTHDYTVAAADADVLGNIVIVYSSYTISSYTVKVIKHNCAEGSTVILNNISDNPTRGFAGWTVDGRELDGDDYTVVADDAENGFIVLFSTANEANKYTVIVVGDSSVTVWRNQDTGALIDLDRGIWHNARTGGTVEKNASNQYTVSASHADVFGNRFIVLYKTANDGTYTVIEADGSSAKATAGMSVGDLVEGVGGWHVNIRDIDNSTYTVRSYDADVTGSIVLGTTWSDLSTYKVVWKDGDTTVRTDNGIQVGKDLSAPSRESDVKTFLGWRAATGTIDNVYTVSHADRDENKNTITLYAIWSDDTPSGYRVVMASERGSDWYAHDDPHAAGDVIDLKDRMKSSGYKHIGWRVITGSNQRLITAPYYYVDIHDADNRNTVILMAEWAKAYTVTIDGDPVHDKVAGDAVQLDYVHDDDTWKVRYDVISKGGEVDNASNTFTMNYDAVWTQIPYSVHLVQPANGAIEVYMEDRGGSSTSRLLTDEEVNSMVFYYGDKLRISYTPNNSKVSFIKWIVTNTSLIESTTSASTLLVIQDDCAITVDESTGRMMDLMIAFDDDNLDARDRTYTRVFMRDPSSGDYYEASYVPGLVKMDHYMVKVPYGTGYEVVLWYGWGPGPADSCDKLEGFANAPDEYVLVGTVDVTINGSNSYVYDVISAGFIDTIDSPNKIASFVDTEYGTIEREYDTDPKFDFLYTYDEYVTEDAEDQPTYAKDVKKNGETKYHIKSDNTVYDTAGHLTDVNFYTASNCLESSKYTVNQGDKTVYTPIIRGSNGGNIVVYDRANVAEKYTVIKVTSNGSVSADSCKAVGDNITGVDGWFLKGRAINNGYTVKAKDADAGGFIVIYQSANDVGDFRVVTAVWDSEHTKYNVSISPIKESKAPITLGAGTWYVKGRTITDEDTHTEGTQYRVNPTDAYPGASESALDNTLSYVTGTGAGHPIMIKDSEGNIVAKVTKYIGIQREMLARLAANNLNINNPDGGTPPVVLTLDPNYSYNTYEGFPWKDVTSRNVFAIESDINLAANADSNKAPQKTFYLNWVRTDSPADIIIQMSPSAVPEHYATADVRIVQDDGSYKTLFEGIRYDIGSSESDSNAKGFIVLFQTPNVTDRYTVVMVGSSETTAAMNLSPVDKVTTGEVLYDVTGAEHAAAEYTIGNLVTLADENRFIVLYAASKANLPGYYTAVTVSKGGTATPHSGLVAGNTVEDVDGWHVNDRILHGDYVVDPTPYYHTDAPVDVVAAYVPVPEVYNGGNIILYETPNTSSHYTVVKVPTVGNATIIRGCEPGDPETGVVPDVDGWYVKGRTITTSYTVEPDDADVGGYIVLYQSLTADGEYNVVTVPTVGNATIIRGCEPGDPETGVVPDVDGWYVKGRTISTEYAVEAGDAYTSGIGDGGECYIIHGNELHLKVPTNCDSRLRIIVSYEKGSVWYVLNDSTYGHEGTVTYPGYAGGVTGSGVWGGSMVLPSTFKDSSTLEVIDINLWVVGRPDGSNYNIEKKDGVFTYEFTKAGAILTSDFIYTVQTTHVGDYSKEVLQGGSVLYYIDSQSAVFNAETGDPASIRFYTNRTCTTLYTVESLETTIYTDTRVIFTPLAEQNFITLTFSTYYGEFDMTGGQRLSVSVPAGGTMAEYARTMAELASVSRFIVTYDEESGGEWEYYLDGFYWGEEKLNLSENTKKVTSDRTYIASWTPNESYKKMFSYTNDGHSGISALRDAVVAEAIGPGELKRFVTDTEITISIQPESGYVIDLDRTRGELGYMLVGTEIYVDITTAGGPTGSAHSFSSWKLWDEGSPTRANYQVTELTDDAKEGFLVYIANWSGASAHAGNIGLIFVTDTPIAANAIYADDGDTRTIPDGSWKIWNKGTVITDADNVTNGLQYVVDASQAIDGYIVFVKSGMSLNEYNAVFATEYGTVPAATKLDHYYKDANGNRYHKTDPDRAYRYEVVSLNPKTYDWVEYKVTNLAGHDGLFIMQFSTDTVSYKATREGQFYKATPNSYTVTAVDGSGHITGFSDDSSEATYTVTGGVIKDSSGNKVNMKLFTDEKLTNRIVDLTTYTTTTSSNMYTGNFVECDPVQGFFAAKQDDTVRTYYGNKECTEAPALGAVLLYAKPVDVVETYMYKASHHYVLRPFGSEYECFETSILQYEITPYGSQFRDIFGTVWAKDGSGALRVVSAVVWEIDPVTNKETSTTITNLATELPAQYYLKDSYGNYYKGNYFDDKALTISRITLKVAGQEDDDLWVKYINDNEYVKGLYESNDFSVDALYLLKRNGQLVRNDLQKTPVDGTLYYYGTTVPYYGDYTIVTTVSKYSTDTEVRINGITYHKDGYGNLYYDWLGSPTELPGNRGYTWTFLLKDSIEITFYMKEVSYDINFVVNGNKVKATDMNAISTVTTMNSGISNSGNVAAGAKVDLDSDTWYSYKDASVPPTPVTKTNDQYTVASGDALNKFILLYKTANTSGTYTVVKVNGDTTMYRSLKVGDKVQLDDDDWYNAKGASKVDTTNNQYAVNAAHANNGFIVLYKTAPTDYNVLKVDDAAEYYGSSIRQYTIVAFDGPSSNRAMKWYTDPDYKNEYTGFGEGHILTPDKFEVDITMPTALTAADKTFSNWTLFGTGTYSPVQSLKLTGGSQHLAGDVTDKGVAKNYFYIVEAAWTTHGSGTYKIVYASQYNNLTENMVYRNGGTITLMSISDEEFLGWKVWNTGSVLTDADQGTEGVQYTIKDADAVTINGVKTILMVADYGEDLTYANNVVYATEYGTAPKMESIRKYQYNATRDITLYGHTGTYVVFLHDFDGTREPMKFELLPDENYRITIPQDHYTYGDYVFVGWSAYNVDGKRVYTYAPEESINISALNERVNLYPFYLSDGSDVKYYDGLVSTLKLGMDDVLRKVQAEPSAAVLKVSYSDSPIDEYDPQHAGTTKSGIHAGDYYVYYAAEIKTPLGQGDGTHGNTIESYGFYGKATLKIMKVDAFVIAPSAYLREGDGYIIAASDPADLLPGDISGGNIVFTSYDITLIGLVPADVDSKKLYTNDGDKEEGMGRTAVEKPSDTMTIRPLIVFSPSEAEYAAVDYNLKYIDGSLTIYPIDATKYEGEGNI